MNVSHNIFITGGTGYMGSRLIPLLIAQGHTVRALVRESSIGKLPAGGVAVNGNALSGDYAPSVSPADTFIHLIGVSHPSPAKAAEFELIDLVSLRFAVQAAVQAKVKHFIFVSVAHPAPMMQTYIAVREQCEQIIAESGLNATILRPWYVLGPGHRWPYVLKPFYWIAEHLPSTRESAVRLGLVTLNQMLNTLVHAANHPAEGIRVIEVPEIRTAQATEVFSAARAG